MIQEEAVTGSDADPVKLILARLKVLFSRQHGEIIIKKHGKELLIEEVEKTKLAIT